ncbi:MAG: 16S rRNA (cytidine(1402)-2'-O)-methyltransferase [Fidelibacterota bacterium]
MPGILYVVSTPIGNLKDITYRAVSILENADIIAAEDTRTSRILLSHYKINTKIVSYHEHNERFRTESLCKELENGKNIALITDAGTPCISDPGYVLVNEVRKRGIQIYPIPGPSSLTTALSISGLPTEQVLYTGFLPRKKGRKTRFEFLSSLPVTIVIFESPHRVIKTIMDIESFMGDRVVSVCRELTKKFEEVIIGPVSEVHEKLNVSTPKGEFVILVAREGYSL